MSKKIYVKPVIPINTVDDVITALFTLPVTLFRTGYAKPTYSDKDCTKMECCGQRRSFEDLLRMANTHFPGTTELELMAAMKRQNILSRYCDDVRKIVFYFYCGRPLADLDTLHVTRGYARGTYKQEALIELYEQV